jgi:chromosome segregation ATPase
MNDTLTDQARAALDEIREWLPVRRDADGCDCNDCRDIRFAHAALDGLAAEYVRLTDELADAEKSAATWEHEAYEIGKNADAAEEEYRSALAVEANARAEAEGRCARLTEQLAEAKSLAEKLEGYLAAANNSSRERGERAAAAEAENTRLRKNLKRATFLAEHLHQMIDPQTWRDHGGDDGQGHYEGDFHAEKTLTEIRELAALAEGAAA